MRLTCLTRSVISTLRSRQRRRRSSSSGVGALTIAHTRGAPRLFARRARNNTPPPLLSVFSPPPPRLSCQSPPAGADGMSQLRLDRRLGFRSLHSSTHGRSRNRRGRLHE